MHILLVIIISSTGSLTTNSIKFQSEKACLQAINELINVEDTKKFKVRARCVKE